MITVDFKLLCGLDFYKSELNETRDHLLLNDHLSLDLLTCRRHARSVRYLPGTTSSDGFLGVLTDSIVTKGQTLSHTWAVNA